MTSSEVVEGGGRAADVVDVEVAVVDVGGEGEGEGGGGRFWRSGGWGVAYWGGVGVCSIGSALAWWDVLVFKSSSPFF